MLSRANLILDLPIEPFVWLRWEEPAAPPPLRAVAVAPPPIPHGLSEDGEVQEDLDGGEAAGAPTRKMPDYEALEQEHQAKLAALERDAFTKGYAQGERAGMEAGAKRAEAMLRRVALTVEELGALRQTLANQSERQMVQLALMLSRRIVHREVSLDPELVAAMAHVALKKLGSSSPATIRLNPDDYTVVARESARWTGTQVTVTPDPSIPRGGCLVESEFGRVDATLETQFEEITRALLGDSGDATFGAPPDSSSPPNNPER
jgi:flagellar assembly protein FliH